MSKIWKIIFILTIALPIGSSNYSWLDFLQNRYGITILDVAFIGIFIYELIVLKHSSKLNKKEALYYLLFITLLFAFALSLINGYNSYDFSAIRDSFQYFICLVFLISAMLMRYSQDSYKDVLDLTSTGFIAYTLVTIITFVVFYSTGERVGASSFSLAIILVPYELFNIMQETRKRKNRSLLVIFCFLINALISQNRTTVILVILESMLVLLFIASKKLTKKNFNRIVLIFILSIFIILIAIRTNSQIVMRIITGGEIDTFAGRLNTFNYYLNLIKDKPTGYGFGFVMHFFTAGNYQLTNNTFQVDNAIAVYGIKGGYLFLILSSIFAFLPFRIITHKNSVEKKIFIVSYAFFIVGVYLMTSQIIQGRSTAILLWTLSGLTIRSKNNKNNFLKQNILS